MSLRLLARSFKSKSTIAGTIIEKEATTDLRKVYNRYIEPILQKHPGLWQGRAASFSAFQNMCGIVQSRAFHLQADNWLTGVSDAGDAF